jgi:hypothetical protein
MKRTIASLMFVGLISGGAAAYAQEATGPDPASPQEQSQSTTTSTTTTTSKSSSASKHQLMKECVARQQASNNTLSKDDARDACKAEMETQKDIRSASPQPDQPE